MKPIYFIIAMFAMIAFAGVTQQGFSISTAAYAAESAQPAVATTTTLVQAPAQDVAKPVAWLEALVEWAKHSGGLLAGLLVALEVALRMFPTVKPKSVLVPVKYVVDGLLVVLGVLSNFLVGAINVANKSEIKIPPSV